MSLDQKRITTYTIVDLASMLVAYLIPWLCVLWISHGCGKARTGSRWPAPPGYRRAVHVSGAGVLVHAAAGIVVHPRCHHDFSSSKTI